jgi:hypothetical protein
LHIQPASWLVAGNFVNSLWWDAEATAGKYIKFDFGASAAKVITEAKFYQGMTDAHGVWQWQGSNNDTDWTVIGANFTLGGVLTQTITTLGENATLYRYYRLWGVSGTTSNTSYIRQFEFKINSIAGMAGTDVNNTPAAPTAGNNGPICAGSTLDLTASTISGATYAWTGPNGFTSALQNPSITNATTAAAGTYSVTATVSGCTSPAGTIVATVNVCAGPSAMGDGAADGAQGEMASFVKAAGWVQDPTPYHPIDATYDTTRCPSSKTIILYGRMDPNGDGDLTDADFTGYYACALANGGSSGSTGFDSTGQTNVWYNIVWASTTGVAGHPGFSRDATLGVVARTWSADGLCGATDIGSYQTCP